MTFNFTIDAMTFVVALYISFFGALILFLTMTFRKHNKQMKFIDQTAEDRKKLIRFMYMSHLPEDLAQKLKDEFNAVTWEVHQDSLKNYGSARHLYPTFAKTYEWILK